MSLGKGPASTYEDLSRCRDSIALVCTDKVMWKGKAHTSGGDGQPGVSRWMNAYHWAD
jgi:hypothetical protein